MAQGATRTRNGISGCWQCLWLGMTELGLICQHGVFGAGALLRGRAQLYLKNRLGCPTAPLSWAWRVRDSPAPLGVSTPGEGTLLSPPWRGPEGICFWGRRQPSPRAGGDSACPPSEATSSPAGQAELRPGLAVRAGR